MVIDNYTKDLLDKARIRDQLYDTPDTFIQSKLIIQEQSVESLPVITNTRLIYNGTNDSFYLDHPTNGLLDGTTGIGGLPLILGDHRSASELHSVVSVNNTFRDYLRDDLFWDSDNSTATLDTTNHTIALSASELAIFKNLYKDNTAIVNATVLLSEGRLHGSIDDLSLYLSNDNGDNWTEVSNGVKQNFTVSSASDILGLKIVANDYVKIYIEEQIPENNILFEDYFNRADSATVGNDWTENEDGCTCEISSNKLLITISGIGLNGVYQTVDDMSLTKFNMKATFNFSVLPNNGEIYVIVHNGTSSLAWIGFDELSRIFVRNGAAEVILDTYSTGIDYIIELVNIDFSNDKYDVKINGTLYNNSGSHYTFGNTAGGNIGTQIRFVSQSSNTTGTFTVDNVVCWNGTSSGKSLPIIVKYNE